MNYILDTNILLTYVRDNVVTQNIENELNLITGNHNLVVSVVSVGEIKSIAKQNKWGERRINRLNDLFLDFIRTEINTEDIIEKYAEIDTFSQGKLTESPSNFTSRNMGKNDIWIAATASVYNLELITTDKDFEHLRKDYLNINLIDLKNFK